MMSEYTYVQQWTFTPVNAAANPLADGIYTIQSAARLNCGAFLSAPACPSNTLQLANTDTGQPSDPSKLPSVQHVPDHESC